MEYFVAQRDGTFISPLLGSLMEFLQPILWRFEAFGEMTV